MRFFTPPKPSLTPLFTLPFFHLQNVELVNLQRKTSFDYVAQESSSVASLVVRGRSAMLQHGCTRSKDSVTLQNLISKLDTIKVFESA
jgi:hypothetical protein